MDSEVDYCISGDGNPGVYEDLYGMFGDTPIYNLICVECNDKKEAGLPYGPED